MPIDSRAFAHGAARMLKAAPGAALRTINKVIIPIVKAGVGSPPPIGGGIVILETTGRRSGLARQVPLVSVRLGDRVVVSTISPRSQWLRNLEASPQSRVWINGRARPATADVRRGLLSTAQLSVHKAA